MRFVWVASASASALCARRPFSSIWSSRGHPNMMVGRWRRSYSFALVVLPRDLFFFVIFSESKLWWCSLMPCCFLFVVVGCCEFVSYCETNKCWRCKILCGFAWRTSRINIVLTRFPERVPGIESGTESGTAWIRIFELRSISSACRLSWLYENHMIGIAKQFMYSMRNTIIAYSRLAWPGTLVYYPGVNDFNSSSLTTEHLRDLQKQGSLPFAVAHSCWWCYSTPTMLDRSCHLVNGCWYHCRYVYPVLHWVSVGYESQEPRWAWLGIKIWWARIMSRWQFRGMRWCRIAWESYIATSSDKNQTYYCTMIWSVPLSHCTSLPIALVMYSFCIIYMMVLRLLTLGEWCTLSSTDS